MLINKFKKALKEKRLFATLKNKIAPYVIGLLIIFFKKKNKIINIHIDNLSAVEKKDKDIHERIFHSFKLMKKDQENCNKIYQPSSLWQNHIDNDYNELKKSTDNNNIEKFSFFLSNFGNWKNYLGIENQILIKKYNSNILLRNYFKYEIMTNQINNWNLYSRNDSSLQDLNMPRHGNQAGVLIENNFLTPGSVSNYFYAEMINNFLTGIDRRQIIADLGGGYGKLAYYILKNKKNFCFIDLDLPETLCLAAYYLMKTWPDKKTFLYGENSFDKIDLDKFDFIFLPNYEIEKLDNNSVDIFLNKNSLGEMDPDSSKNYVKIISEKCNFFFHMNHETNRNYFDNGKCSLINSEYPISKDLNLILRQPDLGDLIYENNKINYNSDIFTYVYKKN
jgi:hypothetical protein